MARPRQPWQPTRNAASCETRRLLRPVAGLKARPRSWRGRRFEPRKYGVARTYFNHLEPKSGLNMSEHLENMEFRPPYVNHLKPIGDLCPTCIRSKFLRWSGQCSLNHWFIWRSFSRKNVAIGWYSHLQRHQYGAIPGISNRNHKWWCLLSINMGIQDQD